MTHTGSSRVRGREPRKAAPARETAGRGSHARWRGLAAAAALLVLAAWPLGAQGGRDGEILLRVHPRVGDTLHTRLEQRSEVSATVAGNGARSTKSVTTSVLLLSRTIVQGSSSANTLVLTIVDSADLRSSDEHAAQQIAAAQRSLRGQQLLLQLGADGTVESARDARGLPVPRDLADAMSAMPAVFPRRPVRVGEQWTRELPLPAGGPLGARGTGHVNATFRLDSLDREGDVAFISLRGEILPDAGSVGLRLSGDVSGAMQVDRQRGWMTDSRFDILVRSLVTPPAGAGLAPMRFVTRVTQRLRTMDKR